MCIAYCAICNLYDAARPAFRVSGMQSAEENSTATEGFIAWFQEKVREIGEKLYPVSSLDDAAALLEAAAAVPSHIPGRARRVLERLKCCVPKPRLGEGCELDLEPLLETLSSQPAATRVVSSLPPAEGMVLLTTRTVCVCCNGDLKLAFNKGKDPLSTSPAVYTKASGPLKGKLLYKQCTVCTAKHYYSYATEGARLEAGAIQMYPECLDAPYIHFTPQTVWGVELLDSYSRALLHHHASARSFERAYADEHNVPRQLPGSWRERLMHAWYALEFVRQLREVDLPLPPAPLSSIAGVDSTVEMYHERLLANFVAKWGKGHKDFCRSSSTCNAYIADGHMKCHRMTCNNKLARVIDAGLLGTFVLPCSNSPANPGALYCRECRDASAVRGAAGMTRANMDADLGADAGSRDDDAAEAAKEKAKDTSVYLVDDVLQVRAATIKNEGEAHRSCVKAKKKSFLVSFSGYPASSNEWVCECNVGRDVKRAWEDKKAAAAASRKHAGQRAAEARKLAKPNGGKGGDPNLTAEEKGELEKEVQCNCLKDVHAAMHEKSAGIIAIVSSCGLVIMYDEIFTSESLTQLHYLLYRAFFELQLSPPEVFVYDDACHLGMYLNNRCPSKDKPQGRFGVSVVSILMLIKHKIEIVVDRFHWKNHTGAFMAQQHAKICTCACIRAQDPFGWAVDQLEHGCAPHTCGYAARPLVPEEQQPLPEQEARAQGEY